MVAEDPILSALETVAEQDQDITQSLYQAFAARHPEHAALMNHMDEYMLGRMMGDVLTLLMTPPDDIDGNYLHFEVSSHRAYGVTPEMFPPLLEVVRDTVRQLLGARWNDAADAAWRRRIDELDSAIHRADSAA
ncbi:MAG: globin [Pseudomonadales bacterium]